MERAESAQRRGDTAQAITAYMRALRADATFGKAYFGLSEIRRAAGDLREAELLLNRAVAFPEARAEALTRRSTIHSAAGKADLAIRDLEAAAAAEPSAQRLRNLAGAYAGTRSWVAALSVYRRLRERDRGVSGSEVRETDETVAALAALAAETDAPQHDAAERSWVRRALRQIALRIDRQLSTLARSEPAH
jgi:tetratricopeptide (TPR) repeat protein